MDDTLKYNNDDEIKKITEILEDYSINDEELRSSIYNLNTNKDEQDIELLNCKNNNLILKKENTELQEINNKLEVANKIQEIEIKLIEEETDKFKIEHTQIKEINKINNNLVIKINDLYEENKQQNIQLLNIKSLISIAENNLEEQYNITIKLKYQIEVNKSTITKLNNKITDLKLSIYKLGNDKFNLYIILIYIIYIMCFLINIK